MPYDNTIVSIIRRLKTVSGKDPCKKTIQKIVYLIEESGSPLGYDYTIHFYGPYSADLDYEIQGLSLVGSLRVDYTNYGHLLSVPKGKQIRSLNQTIDNVIQNFGAKSPSELELLATTLFVQRKVSSNTPEVILPMVKKIKGTKYADSQIVTAVQTLHENDFF